MDETRISEPAGDRSKSRLPGLDGLRAIAVLMVLIAHFWQIPGCGPFLMRFVTNAGFGVEMFFVLSGFLITHLLIREEAATGRISLPLFYARRSLRILPPLIVFLIVLGVASYAGMVQVPLTDLLSGLFFLRNYTGNTPETGHLWTLAIEEQYYLLWPALLVLIRGRRARMIMTAGFVILSPFWTQLSYKLAGGASQVNSWRTDLRILPLAVGSLLALMQTLPKTRWFFVLPAMRSGWLAFSAAGFIVLNSVSDLLDMPFLRAFTPLFSFVCVGIFINCLIHDWQAPLTRLMETKPLVWIGTLSYSIYLWQQVFAPNLPGVSPAWFRVFPYNLSLTIGFAVASFYLVEQPLLSMRRLLRPEGRSIKRKPTIQPQDV